MKFSQRFYEVLREKSQTRGWQSAFAKKAGISQSSLSKIISGETKAPELESVSAIVDALGDELFNSSPVIQRPAPYAPVEVVKGEDLPEIPVIGSTGAGNDVELFNASPSYWINILPQYMRPGLVGLIVEGDSMEPTVHKGAIVGIVPYDGSINEGGDISCASSPVRQNHQTHKNGRGRPPCHALRQCLLRARHYSR